jgi:autotransporter passenger strand-loop-strand repeat protein
MSGTIPTISGFTAGDIVISVVGGADAAATGVNPDNAASPITLEEIDPTTGAIVGELVLPQEASGGNNPISGEYGSSSEGTLELAGNGQSLVIAGYGVNATTFNEGGASVYGNAALAQSTSLSDSGFTPVARVIANISYNATVDTSTALFNVFNLNNPRSVATINGTSFYIAGQGNKDATQGVFVAQDGASSATAINTGADLRDAEIYNGALYVSADTKTGPTDGIEDYGALPSGASSSTLLSGMGAITLTAAQANTVNAGDIGTTVHLSPENFFFANATTLYIADGGNPKEGGLGDGGLQKWTLNTATGVWSLDYTLSQGLSLVADTNTDGTSGLIGLSGQLNANGTVTFYATTEGIADLDQTYLVTITDKVANTIAPANESFSIVETAVSDTNIRGIAQAPDASSTTVIASGTISSGADVTNGSMLTVQSGGTASGAVVSSGGALYVSSGGADYGSLVVAGGAEFVGGTAAGDTDFGSLKVSGGSASVTQETVAYGGLLSVKADGAASGTTVLTGGVLSLSGGTAYATIIEGGDVNIAAGGSRLSGGVTFSGGGEITEASPGGINGPITDFAGADTIYMAFMGSGATLTSSHSGGETVVSVTSGAVTEQFTFSGQYEPASFALTSGANSGTDLIIASSTASGTQTVSSGFVATNVTLTSGGSVTIASGGTSLSGSVLSGAIIVSGTDIGSTVHAGGVEYVYGTASGDTISGIQIVSSAGGLTGSVAAETVASGGALDLFIKGATAASSFVESGGALYISGNAEALNTVLSGGAIVLESGKAELGGTVIFDGAGMLEYATFISGTGSSGDHAVISGFGYNDVISLTTAAIGANATLLSGTISGGNTIETVSGTGGSESFIFAGSGYGSGYFELLSSTAGAVLAVSGYVAPNPNVTSITSGQSTPANYVVSSGKTLDVLSGGSASGVTILSGGTADFGGADSGTLLSNGGSAIVTGSESSGTIFAGGFETVLGAAASDAVYGTQLVSAATASVGNETVYSGGAIDLFLKGAVASNIIIGSGGSLNISGNATALNTVISGGGIYLESPKAVLSGTLAFSGAGLIDVTALTNTTSSVPYGDQSAISGFGAGDVVSVSAVGSGATLASVISNGNSYETISGSSGSETFIFSGTYAPDYFALTQNTATGAELTAATCYAAGTRIRAESGDETPVEALRIGDRLLTKSGVAQTIKWIGWRSYDGKFIAGRHLMLPVRIKAGAIADNVPARDLYVSPGHAIDIAGALVPAWRLINGVSVTQAPEVDHITYFHIELTQHEVIFAENCPAESFVDDGCRGQFHNAASFAASYPDHEPPVPMPRTESGDRLDAVRRRIAARAGVALPVPKNGPLRGFVDQAGPDCVSGWAQDCEAPEAPVSLDVYCGGLHLVRVLANAYRADLREAGIGSGCHAFEVRLPAGLSGPVEVRRAADQAPLSYTEAAMADAA